MQRIVAIVVAVIFSTISISASETVKGAQKDYQAFKAEMSAKLEAVEKEIADLRSKAAHKGSSAKETALRDLETTRSQLKADLDNAKESGKDTWSQFKKSFADSIDKLNSKIQKAAKD